MLTAGVKLGIRCWFETSTSPVQVRRHISA
jgi:hypothetical protein